MLPPSQWLTALIGRQNTDILYLVFMSFVVAYLVKITVTAWRDISEIQRQDRQKAQERQLEHETAEREKDRKALLSREVFLTAAEALAKCEDYIYSFSRFDTGIGQRLDFMAGIMPVLGRLDAAASMETVETVTRARTYFLKATLEMDAQKKAISELHKKQAALSRKLSDYTKTRDGLLTRLEEAAKFAGVDKAYWDHLNKIYEDHQADIKRIDDESEHLAQMIKEKADALDTTCFAHAAKFEYYLAEANLAIRNEIGLPLDAERYKSLKKEAQATVDQAIESLHN